MQIEQQKLGLIKIAGGLIIAILGLFGLSKSLKIQDRIMRFAGTTVSLIVVGGGLYLMVLGIDDVALGQLDKSKLGNPGITALIYKDRTDFEQKLKLTFATNENKNTRRLHFKCPDNSEAFTVYNTDFGMLGIPDYSLQCDNESYLLLYTN